LAKANDRVVRNYYAAYLRGARDYCNAYHGGKDRAAMIDVLIKSGTENRPQLLHDYPWPARNPNGMINTDSMLDMQAWYLKSKMSTQQFPLERLVQTSYIREAVRKTGVHAREQGQQARGVPVGAGECGHCDGTACTKCPHSRACAARSVAQAQEETIRVGSVRSTAALATMIRGREGLFPRGWDQGRTD